MLKADPDTYGDVKVFAVDIDDADTPTRIGSVGVSKTTLIFFANGEEVSVYKGQDTAEMAGFLQ